MSRHSIEYANAWFSVVRKGHYHWIEEAGAPRGAAVLPVVGDQILLLSQKRPAQKGEITQEIPRGYANPGEHSAACASRELQEETGLTVRPEQLTHLGRVRPNSALISGSVQLYLATLPAGATFTQRDSEALALDWLPVAQLGEWLASGRLEDSFTLAAMAFYMAAHQTGSLPISR